MNQELKDICQSLNDTVFILLSKYSKENKSIEKIQQGIEMLSKNINN